MLEVVLVGGFGCPIMFSMLCLHPKQSPHSLYTPIIKTMIYLELILYIYIYSIYYINHLQTLRYFVLLGQVET